LVEFGHQNPKTRIEAACVVTAIGEVAPKH
jgi:hypothetical protein